MERVPGNTLDVQLVALEPELGVPHPGFRVPEHAGQVVGGRDEARAVGCPTQIDDLGVREGTDKQSETSQKCNALGRYVEIDSWPRVDADPILWAFQGAMVASALPSRGLKTQIWPWSPAAAKQVPETGQESGSSL